MNTIANLQTNLAEEDLNTPPTTVQEPSAAPSTEQPPNINITPASPEPEFIDLQPIVANWLQTFEGEAGIMIYDLDHDLIAASHQAEKIFPVASIYKLFYVYAAFSEIDAGNLNQDNFFVATRDYRSGSYTWGECLDLMIRESYNGCADPMHDNATISQKVVELIKSLNLTSTNNYGLSSSAADITELLKLYYTHPDFSEAIWQGIADSMLYQPPTQISSTEIYDWRQGLPSGFSENALVYDKVGWEWNGKSWNSYADAAIVEFPAENRHYIMVVLTTGMKSATSEPLKNLGQMLETAILDN